jgi:hypothetical protein
MSRPGRGRSAGDRNGCMRTEPVQRVVAEFTAARRSQSSAATGRRDGLWTSIPARNASSAGRPSRNQRRRRESSASWPGDRRRCDPRARPAAPSLAQAGPVIGESLFSLQCGGQPRRSRRCTSGCAAASPGGAARRLVALARAAWSTPALICSAPMSAWRSETSTQAPEVLTSRSAPSPASARTRSRVRRASGSSSPSRRADISKRSCIRASSSLSARV